MRLCSFWSLASLIFAFVTSARAQSYQFTTLAGSAGSAGNTDGVPGGARFSSPSGLAVDASGNVYVADFGNACVRKVTTAGNASTLANVPTTSFVDSYVPSGVRGLTLDSAGSVFTCDPGSHAIYKVPPSGIAQFFAGKASSIDAHHLLWRFELNAPYSARFDRSGNLIIAGGVTLQLVAPDGTVGAYAGPAASALGAAKPGQLRDLVVDGTGTMYMTDPIRHVVWKAATDGTVTVLAGLADVSGADDGIGSAARFGSVTAIAFTPDNNLLVTDGSTLRTVSLSGEVTTIAGDPNQAGSADGIGGAARFNAPAGIAFDATGNLYVADTGNHTIRKGVRVQTASVPIVATASNSENQDVGARATVTYSISAIGTGLSYQWLKNGTALAGATTATLTLPNVASADQGLYSVSVTNSAGAVTTPIGTLRVYTPTLSTFTTRHVANGGNFLWSISSGPDLLVAVGDGGTILTSPDGQNWTRRTSGVSDWLVGVAYEGGQYVVVGDHGRVLLSSDGIAWHAAANSGTTQRLNGIAYADGLYVAVGEAGTILTSPDADTWTAQSSGVTGWLRGIVARPGVTYYRYVATGQGGTLVASRDGTTWERHGPFRYSTSNPPYTSGTFTDDLEGAAVKSSGETIAVGADGAAVSFFPTIWFTDTGTVTVYPQWSVYRTGSPARLRGVAIGADAIFAMGENGTVFGAQSIRGPWSPLPTGTTANLVAGTFFHDALFVVGENETILQSDPVLAGRLANISTRGIAGNGGDMLTAGFVISGSVPKQVLVRAAGPALGTFGVGGVLAQPVLTLLNSQAQVVATNTGWGTAANASSISTTSVHLGAFPFPSGSADSAIFATLSPGAYTAQVTSGTGSSGLSLVEVYDAEQNANQGTRAVNISTRGQVGTGDKVLIAGFVIDGVSARRVLIRAVGPSLTQFGVTGVLPRPQFKLTDEVGLVHATVAFGNSDWVNVKNAAEVAGAFPLLDGAYDAAAVMTLMPGSWTVQVSSSDTATGVALVEVYELP